MANLKERSAWQISSSKTKEKLAEVREEEDEKYWITFHSSLTKEDLGELINGLSEIHKYRKYPLPEDFGKGEKC